MTDLTNWTKTDKRTLTHNIIPQTKIQLKSPHPYLKNNPRRFQVMIKGQWITDYNGQHGPISEFRTLESAIERVQGMLK